MNNLFGPTEVMRLVFEAFPDAKNVEIAGPGYEAATDFAWAMRVKLNREGKGKTCFLSTSDLSLDSYDFVSLLRDGWAN